MYRILLVLSMLVAPFVALSAQETVPDSGVRIRITGTGGKADTKGRLVALTADSVVYHPEFETTVNAMPLTRVASIDRSRGYAPSAGHILKGAGIGLLSGVAATSLILLAPSKSDGPTSAIGAVVLGPILLAGGTLIGALIGAQHKDESWSPLYPLGREATLIVAPAARGCLAVGMSLPFDVPGNLEDLPGDSIVAASDDH